MDCEVISKFEEKKFRDIGIDLTTSEYGQSVDCQRGEGKKFFSPFLFHNAIPPAPDEAVQGRSPSFIDGKPHESKRSRTLLGEELSRKRPSIQGGDRERSDSCGLFNGIVTMSAGGLKIPPTTAESRLPMPAQQWARCLAAHIAESTEGEK